MSSSVSDDNLEKKFQAVTNTQDSIQTLSLWLLHHKAHHQKIVAAWMKVLKKAKISHRLTLFYLANDVIQNGKRKGFQQFGDSFGDVLRDATLLVRDEQIRPNIQRVFNIWENRNIYKPVFITELRAILANNKVPASAHTKLLAEFKPEVVIEKLRTVIKLELDAASKMSSINLSKLSATNAEIVQQLKDRTHGQQFKREFDESARCLEELIKTITREIKERTELILLLEQSEIYYDNQRAEAKVVVNAYKNFGAKVKTLQKKLEELSATFPSPIPSPCTDAPSPTTSDHELELKLPSDKAQTNEVETLENAPSPVGTPEGLNLSPQKPVEMDTQPVSTQSVGNPIPTLSNFFSNGQTGMSSWLDTFSNKKLNPAPEKNTEVFRPDTSSLDSRLSNLLQNIPNLPSGLQSTIFGSISSGNNTPLHDSVNSPLSGKKESTLTTESTTPIKDEYSGQNTPLQDEESTHSSQAIFQKMASSNKSKDILTSLIQSVSGDKTGEDSQKKDKYSYGTDPFDQGGAMSSFIKKIIPQVPYSSSSPSFYNSAQSTSSTPVQTASVAQTSTVSSYETASFHDVPVYSSKPTSERTEHMSFIPSLVPSMPQDNFSYNNYPNNEYNPELETFDTDMDTEDPIDEALDAESPTQDSLSPVPSASLDGMPRSIGSRRLSTLITVVTKDSPENSLPSRQFPTDDVYKSDKENVTEDPSWSSTISPKAEESWTKTVPPQESLTNASPNEEFFIGKNHDTLPAFYTSIPPPSIDCNPPNGQNVSYTDPNNPMGNPPMNVPLSKIETVQTQRDDMNGRWPGNNWVDNERRPIPPIPPGPPPMPCGMQEVRFFDRRIFPPQHFSPRNNWVPRHRPDKSFYRPYGPHQNKRFPFRGRGRGRGHFQY